MKKTLAVGLSMGLLALACAGSARAQDNAWAPRARAAASYLDGQWGKPDGWAQSEAWQRFVIVDALLDHARRTGDDRWNTRVSAAVRNRSGLYLNDDDLWAVIANVHAWQVDRDPELLDYASTTYRRIVTSYWDDRCGGGIWWDRKRTYKNAITNELLLYASTQLYLATGEASYRDWALRTWAWFEGSTMIDGDGLVNDGLDAACRNNGQPRFTYNQGVLLGGLSDLTRITGDVRYRALAIRTALAATRKLSTPGGILREPVPSIGADGRIFKGVFAFHLGHLLDDMTNEPERPELAAWADRNAEVVWTLSDGGTRAVAGDWSETSSPTDAAAQTSGLAMLLAASGARREVPPRQLGADR